MCIQSIHFLRSIQRDLILVNIFSCIKVDIKPILPFSKNQDTQKQYTQKQDTQKQDTQNQDTYNTNRTNINSSNINSLNINSHSFYQEQENLNKTNSLFKSIYFHF